MQIKLITWNIWHGKYLDNVISYLGTQNADIVALQEVIDREKDGRRLNDAAIIAKKLGYHFTYCGAFRTDRHTPSYEQGNAILSKYLIKDESCHFLSTDDIYKKNAETEPRIALKTSFQFKKKKLTIVTTHLGYSDGFRPSKIRDIQLKELLPLLEDKKFMLVGDFNSLPDSTAIKTITKSLRNIDTQTEKPSYSVYPSSFNGFVVNGLEYRIDYMFASEDITIIKTELGDTKASDHLPMIATIDL